MKSPNNSKISPFGSWKSPINSGLIASATIRLGDIQIDGNDVFWIESRPEQQGRNVLVKESVDGSKEEITPAPFNVRSRAHEYGGGAMLVKEGNIFFVNDPDRSIYHIAAGGKPTRITVEKNMNYADMCLDSRRQRLIFVREEHFEGNREPENVIAEIALSGSGKSQVLISGNDFYSNPCASPDGRKLSWLSWIHPHMPWNETELWVADLEPGGGLVNKKRVAGGNQESVFQPQWSPEGILYFISDRCSGWWNIYRWSKGIIEPLQKTDAEFGLPQWVFGMSTYAFVSESELVCAFTKGGIWNLARLNLKTKSLKKFETPYTYITQVRASKQAVVFQGASPEKVNSVVKVTINSGKNTVIRSSAQSPIDRAYISRPKAVSFTTSGGQRAFAFYYPPQNGNFRAPDGCKPPLVVIGHGGPTAATDNGLNLKIQFWTSRGFAVLDVNFRGSAGYGRSYRESLNGKWGIADVEDCINGATYLVRQGLVNKDQLIIRGGSSGGFTVLAALTFHDVFSAGASYYGISDLEELEKETHKFESYYNHQLVGPYPEAKKIYKSRSPIHFAEKISAPVIFFQGLEDKVVAPAQAEKMVNALRKKKLPVAYLTFEGEGHGFRKAENIKKALDAELIFYAKIFGFSLSND